MACCAFAAFLLLQLVLPFSLLRRRFFGTPAARNAAVVWRRGDLDTAVPPPLRRTRWRGAVAAVVSIEAIALGAYLMTTPPSGAERLGAATPAQWDAFIALHTVWCGTRDGKADRAFHLSEE